MLRKLRLPVIIILLVGLFGALGYWNIRPESFMEHPTASPNNADQIDFYVTNAQTFQFQADGSLHYEMTAERLEHDKNTDISYLTTPLMDIYRGTDLPWKVKSLRAEVSPGGVEVELIDEVKINRTDAKGRPTILTTTRLTVFPDKQYAQTQQAVRIEAANGITTAQGMKAYLNDGRMHLLSKVRGQHEVR